MNGVIFDIKEMAVHDGPGLRTTVFFKGCPLRCVWCHNPEGLVKEKQLMHKKGRCIGCKKCEIKCEHTQCQPFGRCLFICPENCLEVVGETVSAKELAKRLIKNAEVLGNNFGGFTFSGGEPLFQTDFLCELAFELKDYHLCIETSGYTDESTFKEVLSLLDFVIMDIKLYDSKLHKKYTGVGNEPILKNFDILKSSKKPYIIRTPMVPGITDTKENLMQIESLIGNSTWEKLPFNQLAGSKYGNLNMEFKL